MPMRVGWEPIVDLLVDLFGEFGLDGGISCVNPLVCFLAINVRASSERRVPCLYTAVKSCRCLSRLTLGNTGMLDQLLGLIALWRVTTQRLPMDDGLNSRLNGEFSPSFAAASLDDFLAIFGAHTSSKTRNSFSFTASPAQGTLSHSNFSGCT
jgi:hypothetical protein